jgi:hypothetical protein
LGHRGRSGCVRWKIVHSVCANVMRRSTCTAGLKGGTEISTIKLKSSLCTDFRRHNVCPRSLLAGKLPDPVRMLSTICEQHRLWKQCAEKNRTQPIVVRLTRREGEMYRQAIGMDRRANLTHPLRLSRSRLQLTGL